MGFKFSSAGAGPHPPTYCATRDIFRFNLKVAPAPPATPLRRPHVGTQRITYLLQWNNIELKEFFHPSYHEATVDTLDNIDNINPKNS